MQLHVELHVTEHYLGEKVHIIQMTLKIHAMQHKKASIFGRTRTLKLLNFLILARHHPESLLKKKKRKKTFSAASPILVPAQFFVLGHENLEHF